MGGFAAWQNVPMSSGDDRADYIWQLRADGWSAVEIADEVGLSRSQVHRILAVVGDPARGDVDVDDDDPDPWTDELARLARLDGEDDTDPPGPYTFVGHDEYDEPRWLASDGRSANALHVYRWCFGEGNEDGDTGLSRRRWDEVWTMAGYVRVPDEFGCGTYSERVS